MIRQERSGRFGVLIYDPEIQDKRRLGTFDDRESALEAERAVRPPRKTLEDRFWQYVERADGCWVWTAAAGSRDAAETVGESLELTDGPRNGALTHQLLQL